MNEESPSEHLRQLRIERAKSGGRLLSEGSTTQQEINNPSSPTRQIESSHPSEADGANPPIVDLSTQRADAEMVRKRREMFLREMDNFSTSFAQENIVSADPTPSHVPIAATPSHVPIAEIPTSSNISMTVPELNPQIYVKVMLDRGTNNAHRDNGQLESNQGEEIAMLIIMIYFN
jgi:hypothetical protein